MPQRASAHVLVQHSRQIRPAEYLFPVGKRFEQTQPRAPRIAKFQRHPQQRIDQFTRLARHDARQRLQRYVLTISIWFAPPPRTQFAGNQNVFQFHRFARHSFNRLLRLWLLSG